ncbi:hypothetical protein [Desulforhabdus amnigena]|jgi:shikimate kinase|uniref:Shikimate kinase n=1 Tax=Desulforhabdus amnigena TaxID=40218 RepID=A0A9W6FRE0_9BACT|nr:hypothetical protein [Desulforhabdus amnigena]NLJ27237.1 hypothetical protein [Deltaproteobacteria bacterium]GLI32883.1 hypothetical protein DAMNIGENAA_03160 [Desulforhabdus amnigena]
MKEFSTEGANVACCIRLSLMGMSGSGKSYWSRKLEESGFQRFCCDDLIALKLGAELRRPDGTLMGMGEWMGFPYDPHYRERESKYLACEIKVLEEILEYLESAEHEDKNIVVDTTGSVIYTGETILERLRTQTTIVHLSTPPEVQEQMFRAYVARPTPLLWRDLFDRKPSETDAQALTRCYANLLTRREKLYAAYAAVEIGYFRRRQKGFTVEEMLSEIRSKRR